MAKVAFHIEQEQSLPLEQVDSSVLSCRTRDFLNQRIQTFFRTIRLCLARKARRAEL